MTPDKSWKETDDDWGDEGESETSRADSSDGDSRIWDCPSCRPSGMTLCKMSSSAEPKFAAPKALIELRKFEVTRPWRKVNGEVFTAGRGAPVDVGGRHQSASGTDLE